MRARFRLQFSLRTLLAVVTGFSVLMAILVLATRRPAKPAPPLQEPRIVVVKERFGSVRSGDRIVFKVIASDGYCEYFNDYEPFGTVDELLVAGWYGPHAEFICPQRPFARGQSDFPITKKMEDNYARLKELVDSYVDVDALRWYDYLAKHKDGAMRSYEAVIPLRKDFERSVDAQFMRAHGMR
ncbi:MAG: hypothetical protein ACYC35_17765 [Pirellulales bacterium]